MLGQVCSLEYLKKVYNLAKNHNLKVHIDGARVFNAIEYLQCDIK